MLTDELLKIPYAFRLSRATVRNVKANFTISIVMKAAFVGLAIAGVATLWMAVLADTGASLIVWTVLAPSGDVGSGALAGDYGGIPPRRPWSRVARWWSDSGSSTEDHSPN